MRKMKVGAAMVVLVCGAATPLVMGQSQHARRAKAELFTGELQPATPEYMLYRGVRYPITRNPADDSGVVYNNTTGPYYVLNAVTPDWRNSLLEDFSFSPGPAGGGGVLLTSMDFAVQVDVNPTGGFDLAFDFFDTLTPANSPVNTGPNPNNTVAFHLNPGAGGWVYQNVSLAGLPGGGVSIPDDAGNGFAMYARQTNTTTLQPGVRFFYAVGPGGAGSAPTVGGSAPGTWSDRDQNGTFDSGDGVIVGAFTASSNTYAKFVGTYTPVAQGACCLVGSCTPNQTSSQCTTLGGVWLGAGTACGTCPPAGACCMSAGVCVSTLEALCTGQNGVYSGDGTTCPPSTPCNTQYFLDDGAGELNVGYQSPTASIAMVNQFTVANNLTTINSIDVAVGDFAAGSLNGLPCDVYLWSDPNQDGNPADAVVLAHASGVVANSGTNTFTSYPIPPTAVGANGTKFFVGFILTSASTPGGSFYPGLEDEGHLQNRSWFLGNTTGTPIDPANLGGIAAQSGNWLIRADGAAGTAACYANCDHSTQQPCLNVLDFGCFLNAFAAGQSYANCDNSTQQPVLNVLDFGCFLNQFAAGCSSC
jgi:hypothetical protein